MSNVVNLRMARKRKSRRLKEEEADQNRALHSISRKERDLKNARNKLESSRLDGHEIKTPEKDK